MVELLDKAASLKLRSMDPLHSYRVMVPMGLFQGRLCKLQTEVFMALLILEGAWAQARCTTSIRTEC